MAQVSKHKFIPLRKPTKLEHEGILDIQSEIGTIIDDLNTYKEASQKRRARAYVAGLNYIDLALAKARGES